MKKIDKFLSELYSLDVKLWVEGDCLRCNAPDEVLTPSLSAQLCDRKTEIIAFLNQAHSALHSLSPTLAIQPISRQGNLPLSFAQQRLWFLAQLEQNNPFYNIPVAVRLQGQLNLATLEQTFNEILSRHETLRTNFQTVEGQPVAVISPIASLQLPLLDLSELPNTQKEAEVKQQILAEAQLPFDLKTDLLLRVKLLRLGEQEHILLATMHHIASDGWSIGVMVSEVATLYEAFCAGQPSPLPQLPIHYADFAAWQRQCLQGEALQAQMSYWRKQLESAPSVLELPIDQPRSTVGTFRGASYSFEISKELSLALNQLSQQAGSTLFMTLLAAFNILLGRYTGNEDIVVGTPIANRNRAEIEGLIGFFVNTLVMRTNLSGNPSFLELLERVREVTLGAYTHQDLPFEQLVEALQPQRSLSHTPLFQVMFVLQNAPMLQIELPGLTLSPLESDTGTAKFDLTLIVSEMMPETEPRLRGKFEYNTDLFDASTITRMVEHFCTLLSGIAATPERRISELPLLTEAERHQLLVEWNQTRTDHPKDRCIHQLFEEQVERSSFGAASLTPDAIAVVFEDQHLTYRELNAKANQLARYLQALGVKPDVLVGICVERSLEMVVGLLGILKAGGAYVPLDPAYPPERLAFMLEDSQVAVLLTLERLVEKLPEHGARVVCLDADWDAIARERQENPISGVTSENLAYVIYTSGSTGQPKGVLITHANVVRLFAATQSWFQFSDRDVWTLFHSYAFDFSVWELWGALLYGGRLVVVPYWVSRSPDVFYDLLCKEQVTVLNQTPSAFCQLMRVEETSSTAKELSLRWVIFGGEALNLQSLKPWFERHGDRCPQLVNMYGITETTVHVTYRPLTAADLTLTSGSAIGCRIPDLQIYILDRDRQPVPIGVPGEMYIGGAGLARGYLNRPELTRERFIPNPFKTQNSDSERLYRSGDLARYLANGDIEYLGRIDHQVKIRGFRIELGEIEAVLSQHPTVAEVLVLTQEQESGERRLVAYIVPVRSQGTGNREQGTGNREQGKGNREQGKGEDNLLPVPVSLEELRNFLAQKLPNYMVPATFVLLEAIPLTPNGKVDRRALPDADTLHSDREETFVAPRNAIEEALARVWADVLGVERVGIRDNFFHLGGDSIRSIQVRARSQAIGLDFSIEQLFRHQTISELAREVNAAGQELLSPPDTEPFSLISERDRLRLPNNIEDAYPLAMLQMGMLFHSAYTEDSSAFHDVFSFHLRTPLDIQVLQVALGQLATRHPALRTSFNLTDFSEPLQLVRQSAIAPLQVEDLRHLSPAEQEEAIAAWIEAEKKKHFDWTRPPLLRWQIHYRSENTFQFSLSFHHAILDGWSVASMLAELFERYFFLSSKEVTPIEPPPANKLRDFVALQKRAIDSQKCKQYWFEKLSDSTSTILPRHTVSQQPAEPTSEVRILEVPINLEVSQGLKKLAQSATVPLKSVLVAAHLKVISQLCKQSDVVTILSSNGRPETTDGERSLGLFLTPLPFRMKLLGGTWMNLVRETFAAELEFLPFRWYPMAQIQRDLGGQYQFETGFNFTHFHVYQRLQTFNNLQVLGAKHFEMTDFVLLADFTLNVNSSQIQLFLKCKTSELSSQQIEEIGDRYAQTLKAIAEEPLKIYKLSENETKQKTQLAHLEKASLQKLKSIKRKTVRG
jgi:amino acid adenylation domain-containing protein